MTDRGRRLWAALWLLGLSGQFVVVAELVHLHRDGLALIAAATDAPLLVALAIRLFRLSQAGRGRPPR